jgi:hypothetical protein
MGDDGMLEGVDDIGDLRPVDVELVNIDSGGNTSHKDAMSYEMDAQVVMEKYQAQVKYNVSIPGDKIATIFNRLLVGRQKF